MTDTPESVRKKQLEIWLSRPPGERLRQFLVDNDAFFEAINKLKKEREQEHHPDLPSVHPDLPE